MEKTVVAQYGNCRSYHIGKVLHNKNLANTTINYIDDDGKAILVRQYRLGVDRELLEIPAGKTEPGEDHLSTIKREMEEEIGYVSDDIELLFDFAPVPAYSEEVTSIYIAKNLKKTKVNRDADEFLGVEKHDMESVKKMILNGEIIDGKTIAAVMAYYGRF